MASRDEFFAATTTDDVLALQASTNQLVLLSAGLGIAAVGVGSWGVMLYGSGMGLTLQW